MPGEVGVSAPSAPPPLVEADHPSSDGWQAGVDRIRAQLTSGLANQRQPATLLVAIENAIREQDEVPAPLTYFGAIMVMLDQQTADGAKSDSQDFVAAACYILTVVIGDVSTPALRMRFDATLTTLMALLGRYADAPNIIRSLLFCIERLLAVQPAHVWAHPKSIQAFQIFLVVSLDARPKVRKAAVDALVHMLGHPPATAAQPTGSAAAHPMTKRAILFYADQLRLYETESLKIRKSKESRLTQILSAVRILMPLFSTDGSDVKATRAFADLYRLMLALPMLTPVDDRPLFTEMVYHAIEAVFVSEAATRRLLHRGDVSSLEAAMAPILALKPSAQDETLASAWLHLTESAFPAIRRIMEATLSQTRAATMTTLETTKLQTFGVEVYPEWVFSYCTNVLEEVFAKDGIKSAVLDAATEALTAVCRHAISNAMLSTQAATIESRLVDKIDAALTDIKYRAVWDRLLQVAEALFDRMGPSHPTHLRGLYDTVLTFYGQDGVGESSELRRCLESAVQGIGLAMLWEWAPPNIFAEHPHLPRRPWLLSLFAKAFQRPLPLSRTTVFGPHTLEFFAKTLLPLADALMKKCAGFYARQKASEGKLYQSLALQIWQLLPGIMETLPRDVDTQFVGLRDRLLQALAAAPNTAASSALDVRSMVCTSLVTLVKLHMEVTEMAPTPEQAAALDATRLAQLQDDLAQAKRNLAVIGESAVGFLNNICRMFLQAHVIDGPMSRRSVQSSDAMQEDGADEAGQAAPAASDLVYTTSSLLQQYQRLIDALSHVMPAKRVQMYYATLVQNLLEAGWVAGRPAPTAEVQERVYRIFDLMALLLPVICEAGKADADTDAEARAEKARLVSLVYSAITSHLEVADGLVQKKSYKIIAILAPVLAGSELESLAVSMIDETLTQRCTSGARRWRLQAIICLTRRLADEADAESLAAWVRHVLTEVLLDLKEMNERTRSLAYEAFMVLFEAVDELDTFIAMVSAGLAGSSPVMQSATLCGLARLLFDASERVSDETVNDLIQSAVYFLQGQSRETAKSALMFLKTAVMTLDQERIQSQLENIIVGLLCHSRDPRSHLKLNVRHLFERLVRRFSFEAIRGFVPAEDQRYMTNMRKSMERDHRNKSKGGAAAKDATAATPAKPASFQDVIDSDDEEEDDPSQENESPQNLRRDAFARDNSKADVPGSHDTPARASDAMSDDEDIVDFLDRKIVTQIADTTRHTASRKPAASGATGRRPDRDSDLAKSGIYTDRDGHLVIRDKEAERDVATRLARSADPQTAQLMQNARDANQNYMEAITGEAALSRGADGRLRYVQKGQKRSRDAVEDGDEGGHGLYDETGAPVTVQAYTAQRHQQKIREKAEREQQKLSRQMGQQFKAKNAKGDNVAPGKVQPFAYVPLGTSHSAAARALKPKKR
ncbi:hypothetical protein CXG81DRAFT_21034 [Caulochytrium protostelioides]|uniref:Uncharacterized protein n=1 Tax=Caulochytrium protostelioides TaxID=1555241 RepID=A0A4P9X1J9_9FUNG|nr:hypothetical protein CAUPRSCDRAFT_11080 [Caulochytrium protostelioides]RKO98803.1 hypothetical protein CXG81DRAFT_21034 [Caulochytrium protostelioides]|eukprot:RKO98803.1 hypothetical protein CXG81DRAFT_21034 [Caulochytrium protostelioides]